MIHVDKNKSPLALSRGRDAGSQSAGGKRRSGGEIWFFSSHFKNNSVFIRNEISPPSFSTWTSFRKQVFGAARSARVRSSARPRAGSGWESGKWQTEEETLLRGVTGRSSSRDLHMRFNTNRVIRNGEFFKGIRYYKHIKLSPATIPKSFCSVNHEVKKKSTLCIAVADFTGEISEPTELSMNVCLP